MHLFMDSRNGSFDKRKKRREGKMKVVYLPASGKGRDPSAREREKERGRDGPFKGPPQQGALLSCSEKRHKKVLNPNQAPELFYQC